LLCSCRCRSGDLLVWNAGVCKEKGCTHSAKLSKVSPADCLTLNDCNLVCAMAGWCVHPNNDGNKAMLKTLYKGSACQCPSGVIMKVSTFIIEVDNSRSVMCFPDMFSVVTLGFHYVLQT
jgi:hypothetical protein